jgi:hypothetical protein
MVKSIHSLGRKYVTKILERSYANQKPDARGPNERPLEYAFALSALSLSACQDALDVGTGKSSWPALLSTCGYHVTAIDFTSAYSMPSSGYGKGNPFIAQIYDRKTLDSWGGRILRQTYYECFSGQF